MTTNTELGVWVWGSATALLAIGLVVMILVGRPSSVVARIKDAETVLGAVIAASALAWSLFYQSAMWPKEEERMSRLVDRLEQLVTKAAQQAQSGNP